MDSKGHNRDNIPYYSRDTWGMGQLLWGVSGVNYQTLAHLESCMKKCNTPRKQSIVLLDTKMGNKMTGKGMSVGLRCSVIGHTVGFEQGK